MAQLEQLSGMYEALGLSLSTTQTLLGGSLIDIPGTQKVGAKSQSKPLLAMSQCNEKIYIFKKDINVSW